MIPITINSHNSKQNKTSHISRDVSSVRVSGTKREATQRENEITDMTLEVPALYFRDVVCIFVQNKPIHHQITILIHHSTRVKLIQLVALISLLPDRFKMGECRF